MPLNDRTVRHMLSNNQTTQFLVRGETKLGNNFVTIPQARIDDLFPASPPSLSYAEAKVKQLRCYKRFCRMVC